MTVTVETTMRAIRWYVKRKPTFKSAFRDKFPYLSQVGLCGTIWTQTRKDAIAFVTRENARKVLEIVRLDDRETVLVRVTAAIADASPSESG